MDFTPKACSTKRASYSLPSCSFVILITAGKKLLVEKFPLIFSFVSHYLPFLLGNTDWKGWSAKLDSYKIVTWNGRRYYRIRENKTWRQSSYRFLYRCVLLDCSMKRKAGAVKSSRCAMEMWRVVGVCVSAWVRECTSFIERASIWKCATLAYM